MFTVYHSVWESTDFSREAKNYDSSDLQKTRNQLNDKLEQKNKKPKPPLLIKGTNTQMI